MDDEGSQFIDESERGSQRTIVGAFVFFGGAIVLLVLIACILI